MSRDSNGTTGLAPRFDQEAYEKQHAALIEVMGGVSLTLGSIDERLRETDKRNQELLNAVAPVEIPPQSGTVTAAGVLNIASAELLGPRAGYCWDVRRITVSGLASTSEIVNIYRVSSTDSSAAVANNLIATITGKAGTFAPGLGALWLRAQQSIMVAGTGLTNAEVVVATFDCVQVADKWVGAYLL